MLYREARVCAIDFIKILGGRADVGVVDIFARLVASLGTA